MNLQNTFIIIIKVMHAQFGRLHYRRSPRMYLPKTARMRFQRVTLMSLILASEPGLSATTAGIFQAQLAAFFLPRTPRNQCNLLTGKHWRPLTNKRFEYAFTTASFFYGEFVRSTR